MENLEIRIGTRGSALALCQAAWVSHQLEAAGFRVVSRTIKTSGDKLADAPLSSSGTKGLFIKEIEEALLAHEIDLAAHSLKDLPTEQPLGLFIAAVPEREDPRDVLISRDGVSFAQLAPGARVGTSSLRRQTQLRCLRSDLEIIPMRGNVGTRLAKLGRGDCDALVLAAAGLRRLGQEGRISEYFDPGQICPAVGQGALAIEARRNDGRIQEAVRPLDRAETHQAVRAERELLRRLGGGCQVPIAAHAVAECGKLSLIAVVASSDGRRVVRATAFGAAGDAERLGALAAEQLLEQGARAILDSYPT